MLSVQDNFASQPATHFGQCSHTWQIHVSSILLCNISCGHDSSVGITTRYVLEGPRIEIADPSGRAGLRRGSAADLLLWLRVRMPSGACMFVLFVLFVFWTVKDKKQKARTVRKKKSTDKAQREKKMPVWERFSAPVQTGHGAHPASCTVF